MLFGIRNPVNKGILVLSEKLVFLVLRSPYVLTDSVPSQKFSRRAVITGMSDGIQIEIKNGLNVNEKVRGAEKK